MKDNDTRDMDLIVIGNSHVGAMKLGADALEAESTQRMSFFAVAAPAEAFCALADDGIYGLDSLSAGKKLTRLCKRINDGQTSIDLSQSRAVLWAGRYFPWISFAELIMGYDIEGYTDFGAPRRLSAKAFDTLCAQALEKYLPNAAWSALAARGVAVYVAIRPRVSEKVLTVAGYDFWKGWAASPDRFIAYETRLLEIYARALADRGLRYLPQPADTFTSARLTAQKWGEGAQRIIGKPQRDGDVTHMNGEFGARVLESIREDLSKT